jgi:ParB/RepB/Spo0J family partition protein
MIRHDQHVWHNAAGDTPATDDIPVDGLAQCTVYSIPLADIDLADETYRFRADLRIGPLARSIEADGIQIPVILREPDGSRNRYQVVSGFRRLNAASAVGLTVVPAIVRELSDDQAFRVCVLENSSRKTYSDIDRALALRAFRQRDLGDDDTLFSLLGLTRRQQRNILSLLTLPAVVRQAIDDPRQPFTASHGLALRQAARKHEMLVPGDWVERVNAGLSVSQLKRALNREFGVESDERGFSTMFRAGETSASSGVFRLNPVRIVPGEMTLAERRALRAELELMLASL